MDQTTADHRVANALIGLSSRTQALFIYGITAIGIGLAMAFTGVPVDVEEQFGSIARAWLGIPLTCGGALLIAGSFLANEKRWAWWSALVGMLLFACWAATMAVAYAWIAFHAPSGVVIAMPWDPIPPDAGRIYVTVFYQGITMLAAMHVITFVRMGRPVA